MWKIKIQFFFGLVASKFKIHNFEKIIIMKFGALMGPRPLGGSGGARAPPVIANIEFLGHRAVCHTYNML